MKPVRVALIADIHGNLPALEAVLADARAHRTEQIWNLGDFLGYTPFPNDVIRVLQEQKAVSIIGNYDQKVLQFPKKKKDWKDTKRPDKFSAFEWNSQNLSETSQAYLRDLPEQRTLTVGEVSVMLCHGSPDDINEHLFSHTPEARLATLAASAGVSVVVCGHSHDAFTRRVNGTWFVNPGSCGRPEGGDWRAAYAVVTFAGQDVSVKHRRVEYDIERATRAIHAAGLPHAFIQVLKQGKKIDDLLPGEPELDGPEQDIEPTDPQTCLDRVYDVAKRYEFERAHAEQVRDLALSLCDQLADLAPELGPDERRLLEYGSLLHDIGWYEGRQHHHETALDFIMKDRQMPLTVRQRQIVGLLARYHRSTLPKAEHPVYALLEETDRRRVDQLASFLRLADGLDKTHNSVVRRIDCHLSDNEVALTCRVKASAERERVMGQKKADLLERTFQRKVRIATVPVSDRGA